MIGSSSVGLRLRHAVLERQPARGLERQLVRVDVVVRAVVEHDAEVDDRVAGQVAAQPRFLDALLDGRE